MKRLLSPACALAALMAPAAVSSLEWDFAKTAEDRAFVDVKPTPSRPGVPAGAIALDIKLFEGAASVRAATFHLKIGDDWLASAQVDTAALATSRLRVPLGNFAPALVEEAKIDEVRVSVWRSSSPGAGRLVVNSISIVPVSEISVLSGQAGSWMETLARRVAATLSRSRLDCDLQPSVSAAVKSAPRLVIVPDASSLPAGDAELLAGFIRKGGRAIVYYSANPVLSDAFGLRPGTWHGGQPWCAIKPLDGSVPPYPHRADNTIVPFFDGSASAKVEARFLSPKGAAVSPAVTLMPAGAWFSHIPPLPSPAAATHLRSIVQKVLPNMSCQDLPGPMKPISVTELAKFELRGAWLQNPPGFPGGMPALPEWMKGHGLNALFIRREALGSGEASVGRFLGMASKAGVRVHLWLNAFEPASDGRWTVPHGGEARGRRVQELLDSIPQDVAGVQLDYVRMPSAEEATAEKMDDISLFVRTFSRMFRHARPGCALSAAVFPTPEAAAKLGQDWPRWVKEEWVDFVSPMIYTESPIAFKRDLALCKTAAPASALVPGIAACADEASPDRDSVRAQLEAADALKGVSFFALDWAFGALCGYTDVMP
ncbi:MAG: hypothetical protein K6G91_09715 [Kiritimatiellae bacterium]|nr:hypothetical protein [Kiritimatiellia bacterium]